MVKPSLIFGLALVLPLCITLGSAENDGVAATDTGSAPFSNTEHAHLVSTGEPGAGLMQEAPGRLGETAASGGFVRPPKSKHLDADGKCPTHQPRLGKGTGAGSGGSAEQSRRGEEMALLGEGGDESFDWTQCQSEGGKYNCAICSHAIGGALPCHRVIPADNIVHGQLCPDDCPDNNMTITKSFWWPNSGKGGQCFNFTNPAILRPPRMRAWKKNKNGTWVHPGRSLPTKRCFEHDSKDAAIRYSMSSALRKGSTSVNNIFPSRAAPLGRNVTVITKSFITHPGGSNKEVGIFMFKRVVSHKCTGKNSEKGGCKKVQDPDYPKDPNKTILPIVADVYKVGFCVDCTETNFRFRSEWTMYIHAHEAGRFATDCLAKAFDEKGKFNKGFECTGDDLEKAQAEIMAF